MLVGNNKPVSYFSLNKKNNGCLRTKDSNGNEHFFDFIQGGLVGIELRTDEFEGRKTNKYYFKFEPADHSQIGFLQIGEDASAARGLLAALTTIPEDQIRQIHVRPYTTTSVHEGEEVTFVNVDVSYRSSPNEAWNRLIDMEETKPMYTKIFKYLPGETYERREYVRRMAEAVIDRLNGGEPAETVDPDTGEVMDGKAQADAMYNNEPGNRPAPHRQGQKEVHKGKSKKGTLDWADDQDDLPF